MVRKARLGLAVRRLAAVPALVLVMMSAAWAEEPRTDQTAIAVADFDYIDTSGEVRDQKDIHAARVQSFSEAVRTDLTRNGAYRTIALNCREACSALEASPSKLLEEARRQGARVLVFGGIHKQSTLIQWLKVEAVDLQTQKVVFDRLMSFRGDDDASWRRAEEFLVKAILNESPSRE